MTERNLARAMGSEEIQEAAYTDWAAGTKVKDLAEKYGVAVRTIERWRSVGKWRDRLSGDKLEALKTQRQQADEQLTEHMPKIMREAIKLALGESDQYEEKVKEDGTVERKKIPVPMSVRASMLKYLLGTMGYSPEASEQWLKAIEAKVSQIQAENDHGAASSEDYSAMFSEIAGFGDYAPPPPVNGANGSPPESGETEVWEGGEEVWDDPR